MSLRPTPYVVRSSLEVLILHLLEERNRKELLVNQLNTNHNTMVLLLVILLVALFSAVGALALFMLLV